MQFGEKKLYQESDRKLYDTENDKTLCLLLFFKPNSQLELFQNTVILRIYLK